jgi:hypothetical protein
MPLTAYVPHQERQRACQLLLGLACPYGLPSGANEPHASAHAALQAITCPARRKLSRCCALATLCTLRVLAGCRHYGLCRRTRSPYGSIALRDLPTDLLTVWHGGS